MNNRFAVVPSVIVPSSRYSSEPVRQSGTSGMAIASFVTSLLGIWLLGIIFGHVSLKNIRNSGGSLGGTGLAVAGLIISYIQFVCCIIILLLFLLSLSAV